MVKKKKKEYKKIEKKKAYKERGIEITRTTSLNSRVHGEIEKKIDK